ncbi:hypothetical protein EYF80_057939 [Liparis tanakae]|uniref:Uncharacterized protein n=1 Tax=Liparis tanakae TaxID=230148 RepID=A0A4Z2ETK3_9TELE|nr:hypothetical protein EYF80_057939 [Liparis tanakae]
MGLLRSPLEAGDARRRAEASRDRDDAAVYSRWARRTSFSCGYFATANSLTLRPALKLQSKSWSIKDVPTARRGRGGGRGGRAPETDGYEN